MTTSWLHDERALVDAFTARSSDLSPGALQVLTQLGFEPALGGDPAPPVADIHATLLALGPAATVHGLCGLARLMLGKFTATHPGDPRVQRAIAEAEAVYPDPDEARRDAADHAGQLIQH